MDTELLVYMYRVGIETIRRSQGGLSINLSSIGNLYLGTWQSTAKGMKNKKERMSLWNLLFSTAIQEDCWDDVRYVSCSLSTRRLAHCANLSGYHQLQQGRCVGQKAVSLCSHNRNSTRSGAKVSVRWPTRPDGSSTAGCCTENDEASIRSTSSTHSHQSWNTIKDKLMRSRRR